MRRKETRHGRDSWSVGPAGLPTARISRKQRRSSTIPFASPSRVRPARLLPFAGRRLPVSTPGAATRSRRENSTPSPLRPTESSVCDRYRSIRSGEGGLDNLEASESTRSSGLLLVRHHSTLSPFCPASSHSSTYSASSVRRSPFTLTLISVELGLLFG